MSNEIAWIGFCMVSSVSRTLVHFLPAASSSAAPYSVDCSISIFGHGEDPETIKLEGARVGLPDGVSLEELFPSLEHYHGLCGVAVELSSNQVKLSHDASSCVIEFFQKGHSVRYAAAPFELDGSPREVSRSVALQDSYNATSIIAINPNNKEVSARIKSRLLSDVDEPVSSTRLQAAEEPATLNPTLPAHSVTEVRLDKRFYLERSPRECSWGIAHVSPLDLSESDEYCVYFSLYSDAITKRPMSVCSL